MQPLIVIDMASGKGPMPSLIHTQIDMLKLRFNENLRLVENPVDASFSFLYHFLQVLDVVVCWGLNIWRVTRVKMLGLTLIFGGGCVVILQRRIPLSRLCRIPINYIKNKFRNFSDDPIFDWPALIIIGDEF